MASASGQVRPDIGETLLVIRSFSPNPASAHLFMMSSELALADTTMASDVFQARSSDELSLAKGDRVELVERDDEFGDGWFLGRHLTTGNTGLFPEGLFCNHQMASQLP